MLHLCSQACCFSSPIMQVLLNLASISCQDWLLQCKQARATGTVPCLYTSCQHRRQQQDLRTASPSTQADFTQARLEVTTP
jgi:hypothetical protein